MERDDQVRRLTADVEILQAQVAGMNNVVTVLARDVERLVLLMADLTTHLGEFAAQLAEERNR